MVHIREYQDQVPPPKFNAEYMKQQTSTDSISSYNTKVHCIVFKDNSRAVKIAKFPRY
jgi:hypothetical protein